MKLRRSCWSGLRRSSAAFGKGELDGRATRPTRLIYELRNMSQNILFLAHVDESGTALPKAAYEAFGAALELAGQLGSS